MIQPPEERTCQFDDPASNPVTTGYEPNVLTRLTTHELITSPFQTSPRPSTVSTPVTDPDGPANVHHSEGEDAYESLQSSGRLEAENFGRSVQLKG